MVGSFLSDLVSADDRPSAEYSVRDARARSRDARIAAKAAIPKFLKRRHRLPQPVTPLTRRTVIKTTPTGSDDGRITRRQSDHVTPGVDVIKTVFRRH